MNQKGITEFPRNEFDTLHEIYKKWVRKEPKWIDDLNILLIILAVLAVMFVAYYLFSKYWEKKRIPSNNNE